jgi:phospholipid transport system substrate-binding protein
MLRHIVLALVAFVALAPTAPPAVADVPPGVASQHIRRLGDEAIATLRASGLALEAREARFRKLLSEGFDMAFIGRFVLGRHWRTASPDQQSEYMQVFSEYILKVYSSRLGGYAGESLNVVSERPAGDKDVIVNTRIDRPSGPPIEASWRVRVADNDPRIIDIAVSGVSMAVTQRDEFAAVLQRENLDRLIERLRARTDKMTASR